MDSLLPNLNVLKSSSDDKQYWCFMKDYEGGQDLPEDHNNCDLTNEDSTNEPSTTKKHEISFGQKEVIYKG